MVSRESPRPIVMFARDDDAETIREVTRAGVSAYVVDGLDAGRVKPIVDAACARFEAFQRLREELAEARGALAERKVIERAKGILMKAKGIDEEAAYVELRRMAMNRGKRLVEIARSVVDAAELLGGVPPLSARALISALRRCGHAGSSRVARGRGVAPHTMYGRRTRRATARWYGVCSLRGSAWSTAITRG